MLAAVLNDWPPERVAAVLGAIIPIIVAAATWVGADVKVKAAIAAVLAIISGPVASWIAGAGAPVVSWGSAKYAAFAWAANLVSYLAGWKPVLDINAKAIPDKGVGKPPSPPGNT